MSPVRWLRADRREGLVTGRDRITLQNVGPPGSLSMPSAPDLTSREFTFEEIRERAYDLWERHHRPEGFSIELWLMAERELRAEREGRRPGRSEPEPAPVPAESGTAAKAKVPLERIAS